MKTMINLLPPEEKKKLFYKKLEKLVIIWGEILLIFLVCLILVLFSIKTYIVGQVESKIIILDQIKEGYENSNTQNLQQTIKNYNEKLSQIKNFYENQTHFAESIEEIAKIKPPEIYFTILSLKMSGNGIIFSISGFSETRTSLVLFRENLESKPGIENINFSPLSWVKTADIDFQVTFDFKK